MNQYTSVDSGISKRHNDSPIWIGLDTQADGSITGRRALIGHLEEPNVRIHGWDGMPNKELCSKGWNPLLGEIVYSKSANNTTLLSYFDLLKHFNVSWSSNGTICKATSKRNSDLKLDFKFRSSDLRM